MQKSEQERLSVHESPDESAPAPAAKELVMVTQPSKDSMAALHTQEPKMVTPGKDCSSWFAQTIALLAWEAVLAMAKGRHIIMFPAGPIQEKLISEVEAQASSCTSQSCCFLALGLNSKGKLSTAGRSIASD
jgi:hypothetical protein